MPGTFLLTTYLFVSDVCAPIGRMIARSRVQSGKEDPDRVNERFGIASQYRPKGQVIWLHAASVGESLSILALIKELRQLYPEATILLTTGTVSSARVLNAYLEEKIIHQYNPYDVGPWVRKFLVHWQPTVAILVESELWPSLMTETRKASIPLLLINGRFSSKSIKFWQKHSGTAHTLLNKIDYITVQTQNTLNELVNLGYSQSQIEVIDTLKQSAAPLPYSQSDLRTIQSLLKDKIVWIAASTHLGEDELILEVFRSLLQKFPQLFLVIVPRHPERGVSVLERVIQFGFKAKLRSQSNLPSQDETIFVSDTLGELGIWYRLGQFAFIGGSLVSVGGHNPYEPALLGCPIIHGPHTFNFVGAYQRLMANKGSLLVEDTDQLEKAIEVVIAESCQEKLRTNAQKIVQADENSVQRTVAIIKQFMS